MDEMENGERVERVRKPRKCPACGFSPVASIMYGMPASIDELEAELDSGRLVLGGCCVDFEDPAWHCTNCKLDIYRKRRPKNK